MRESQDKVKEFNDVREWSTPEHVKDILLNMNEEIGEMWHLIKWVDFETQKRLIKENKAEVENFVGDMLYLIFKLAFLCDVDSKKAFEDVMAEYEKRFPAEQTKGRHGNLNAGGIDLK